MRWPLLVLPLAVAIAAAGVILAMLKAGGTATPGVMVSPTRHVITAAMDATTWSMRKNPAPDIDTTDVSGHPISLRELCGKGPVFVYFVMDGCPCSVDAQPLFRHLRDQFWGKVSFVGIINDPSKEGAKWGQDNAVPWPLVPDPALKLIHAYKATNSAFSGLVSRNGSIVKMWPGYSKDELLDMNETIAKELGEKPRKFDTLYAPIERTTGCAFEPDNASK